MGRQAGHPHLAHKGMLAYLEAARDLALDNGWKRERNIDLMDKAVLDSMQRLSTEQG